MGMRIFISRMLPETPGGFLVIPLAPVGESPMRHPDLCPHSRIPREPVNCGIHGRGSPILASFGHHGAFGGFRRASPSVQSEFGPRPPSPITEIQGVFGFRVRFPNIFTPYQRCVCLRIAARRLQTPTHPLASCRTFSP